ncbi:hypothetical protein GCM10017567_31910 [Amycolatopsis bullii]|uniref:N-acetyltransferase domain-containing protein n=1 Tax=Amycolatopsis bullii TaxID=941987 RepID=A0ABQ3KE73_9PSEU|nr:hypothetical protein GCM10017567_31910 [Amycolatopsis bullii]
MVRVLGPADGPEVHRLGGGMGLTPAQLERELGAPDCRWVGLADAGGELCAVHRSLRWGPFLFLKGVYVSEAVRGSGAAVRLAFALRDAAGQAGLAGIAAWFDFGMPEHWIAELVRIRPRPPSIYRVALGLEPDGDSAPAPAPARFHGELEAPRHPESGRPLTPVVDLFGTAGGRTFHWMLDGSRLMVSASFGTDRHQLAALVEAVGPVARATGAGEVMFPAVASDIVGALQLAGARARRYNRLPTRFGVRLFDGSGQRHAG